MSTIDSIGTLVKAINAYEHSLYLIILEIVKARIVVDYFDKHKIKVLYCDIHEQGYLLSFNKNKPKNYTTILTKCCNGNYCHLDYLCPFNENFIKNYKFVSTYLWFDFELERFLSSYYDSEKDKIVDTPLEIILFYNQHMKRLK